MSMDPALAAVCAFLAAVLWTAAIAIVWDWVCE